MLIRKWFLNIVIFPITLTLSAWLKISNFQHTNSYLKMVGITLSLLLITFSGCDEPLFHAPPVPFNTEMNCPREQYKIILLEVRAEEIRLALENAIKEKEKFHTTETYTVLKLRNKKSFFFKEISPEQMQYCYLREIPLKK